MPADAVTRFLNALEGCRSLGAGVGAADDSTVKLVARALVAAGAAEAEALALAVDDELAARSAELAALAEHQRSLCVAAAAAPEARLQLMAGWSSFAESAEYVTFEAELTRRLVVEGHSEDEARAAVCTTLATASLDASVHGSVRSGYTLVQGLAAAALQGQEGALLAALHLRLRAASEPSGSPRPTSAEIAGHAKIRALEALRERMEVDPDDPSIEAEFEAILAELEAVSDSAAGPSAPGIAGASAARGRLVAAVESFEGSLVSGDRTTLAAAATQLAMTAEALLLGEVPPLVVAVDAAARLERRASPADAVAVGALVHDLLDASISARRLAWDAGWSAAIDAVTGHRDAAYRLPPPHETTVLGELLAVRAGAPDLVEAALLVDTSDEVVTVIAHGLDPDAVGLRPGSAVSAEGVWDPSLSAENKVLVVARRADSGALAMSWSVEDAAAALLRRRRWPPLEVE